MRSKARQETQERRTSRIASAGAHLQRVSCSDTASRSRLQVVTIVDGEVVVEKGEEKPITTTYTTTLPGYDPVICEGVRAARVAKRDTCTHARYAHRILLCDTVFSSIRAGAQHGNMEAR